MHDTLTTPLPGSWLSSRLGVNPREIEQLRDRGELFAVRDNGEWLYPAWQFGPGGKIPVGVREAVKAARAVGLDEARLFALLRRPAGLLGANRLLDLLFEGRSDFVVDTCAAPQRCEPRAGARVRWPRAHPARLADVSRARRARPRDVRRAGRARARRARPRGRAGRARHARGRQAPLSDARAADAARAERPDVVYAHFLVPVRADRGARRRARRSSSPRTDATSATSARSPASRAATRLVVRRAATVVCVSDYLRRELEPKLPEARGKTEVVSSGVDLERFAVAPAPRRAAAASSASARSTSGRTSSASPTRSRGSARGRSPSPATGRCAPQLEGRARRAAARARRRTTRSRACSPRADVLCAAEPARAARPGAARGDGLRPLRRRDADRRPAGVRPARGRRARRPARRRGPRARRCAQAAALPRPNEAARAAAAEHDVRRQAERIEAILSRAAGSRSASLISTSGRIVSSSPASRATSSACSQLSRAFSGSTPCFSRLSPVTRSFWIRSWASASPLHVRA